MPIEDRLKQSVVRVDGPRTGTGFFVGGDGTILTCYHLLVDPAGAGTAVEQVTVSFNGKAYPAHLLFTPPYPGEIDVAVLRLEDGTLPPEAVLLPLGPWEPDRYPLVFRSFGYRSHDKLSGAYAESEILGQITSVQGRRLLQISSEKSGEEQLRPGMSGAPLLHPESGRVLGLISTRLVESTAEIIPLAIAMDEVGRVWHPIKARLQEELVLDKLAALLKEGKWFTKKQYKSFYQGLPIASLQDYDTLGEDKIQGLLDQLRGQNRVYDFLNCLRTRRPEILPWLRDLPPVDRINFVNRETELNKASDSYAPPYILVDAPAGYGKTELLKAVEQRYFREGWQCAYAEVSPNGDALIRLASDLASYTDYPEALVQQDLGTVWIQLAGIFQVRCLKGNAPGIVLLIDNVERLSAAEVDVFLKQCLSAFHGTKPVRLCLAGRYISPFWTDRLYQRQIRTAPLALTPFRFKYVRDTVRLLYSKEKEQDEELALRAAYLMHTTGGHPRCMAEILKLMDFEVPVEDYFSSHQADCCQVVKAAVEDIQKAIPAHVWDAFNGLSVFRRYNYHLLDQILAAGAIDYEGDADSLERELTATYLVRRKEGLIQDEIVRRLLALRLYWEEPDRFLKLAGTARTIYREYLARPEAPAVAVTIEWLFQELQLAYYSGRGTGQERNDLRAAFLGDGEADGATLQRCIDALRGRPGLYDLKRNLLNFLADADANWEFRFFVNFFLREDGYSEEPYNRLVDRVDRLLAEL